MATKAEIVQMLESEADRRDAMAVMADSDVMRVDWEYTAELMREAAEIVRGGFAP